MSESSSSPPIHKVGVVGAGVMGAAIAAHLANAGIRVTLLDIVPPNLTDAQKKDKKARDQFAAGGLDKALKNRPALFMHKSLALLVKTGNTEDDLESLKDCDLVIEAVIEKMEPKQALFAKLEKILPPHAVVASNTSGLSIADMTAGRSAAFKKNFIVMHFFNPVRYMKLLELVRGPETSDETAQRIARFGTDVLGKGIVWGKDTPNFVANRLGTYGMMATIHEMLKDGLAPEDIDALTGPPMGHPKSASFRTGDLVGLDTFVHVAKNCYDSLTNDEERATFEMPAYIQTMVEKKLLGNKTKAGFYKKGAKKGEFETFDPYKLEYRPKAGDESIKAAAKAISKIEDPRERVKKLGQDTGKAGQFAWKITSKSFAYTARRIPEIADSIPQIDEAMRWGYMWDLGPFEAWDALGFVEVYDRMEKEGHVLPDWLKKMKKSGATSFYKDDGSVWNPIKGEYQKQVTDPRNVTLKQMRASGSPSGKPVLKNDGAEAWDLGDGVLGVTFKTKANSIDPDAIAMLHDATQRAEKDFRGMLVFNEGEHFCVGANLMLVVMAAGGQAWDQIRTMVKGYQDATQRMKYARVPVVVAPFGMTLGGGLELSFAGDAVQAAAETYAGLVEVAVGLIPGGAGTMNMLWRAFEGIPEGTQVDSYAIVTQTFKNIALAKVATSAEEAKQLGFFRKTDGVSFDRARQLWEAKQRVIGMANAGYHPQAPKAHTLPGESGIATLKMMVGTLVEAGHASEHDGKIATKLAEVLCGGRGGAAREVTEDEMLELEREAFISLCGEPKSQERMQYMLMNNKPYRN